MRRLDTFWALTLALAVLLTGCESRTSAPDEAGETPSEEAEETDKKEEQDEPQADESSDPPTGDEALQALDEMDGREPVPLTPTMASHQLENMRDHLQAVQEITKAAAKKDYEGVEKAGGRIATSPEMVQMCNHMGAGADGFTERALGFHKTADGIVEAAKKEDHEGVMNALGDTLETCTSCHSQYKQQVVSEEVWSEKTGMDGPSDEMQRKHHQGGSH